MTEHRQQVKNLLSLVFDSCCVKHGHIFDGDALTNETFTSETFISLVNFFEHIIQLFVLRSSLEVNAKLSVLNNVVRIPVYKYLLPSFNKKNFAKAMFFYCSKTTKQVLKKLSTSRQDEMQGAVVFPIELCSRWFRIQLPCFHHVNFQSKLSQDTLCIVLFDWLRVCTEDLLCNAHLCTWNSLFKNW